MVLTNDYTNEKHKLYNSTVLAISKGGQDCDTKVGSLLDFFVDMVDSVKTQVENGLSKLFNLWGNTVWLNVWGDRDGDKQ